MVRYGRIVRTYLDANGFPVADICDDVTGTMLLGCAFALAGGGSGKTSAYFPPTSGNDDDVPKYADRTRVVYAPVGNGRRAAVILGTLMHRTATKRFVQGADPVDYVDPADSHPDVFGQHDAFIENGGSYFLVSEEGNIVLSAGNGQPVRVQLDGTSSSTLRISQGEDASEAVLLANRTLSYLTTQVNKVNAALVEVQKLQVALAAAKAVVLTFVTGNPKPPAITPDMLLQSMKLWEVLPTPPSSLDLPTDSLVSSLVTLTDVALGDGAEVVPEE